MKIRIKLIGTGGELDRQTIEVSEQPFNRSNEIADAIKCWVLDDGDTIKIEQVS